MGAFAQPQRKRGPIDDRLSGFLLLLKPKLQSSGAFSHESPAEKISGASVGFQEVDLLRSEVTRSSAAGKMLNLGVPHAQRRQD